MQQYIVKNYKPDIYADNYIYCIYDSKGRLLDEKLMTIKEAVAYSKSNDLDHASFMHIMHLQNKS